LSESHADTPLPGGGRRIARPSPEPDQVEDAAKVAESPPQPAHAGARRSHRAAGPPSTLASDYPVSGRRRAPTQEAAPQDVEAATGPDATGDRTDAKWAASTLTPTAFALASADGDPPVVVAPARRDDGPRPSELRRAAAATPTATASPVGTPDAPAELTRESAAPADLPVSPARPEAPPIDDALEPVVDEALQPVADERPHTAWDGPIVTATYPRPGDALPAPDPVAVRVLEPPEDQPPARRSLVDTVAASLAVVGAVAALIAGLQVAETEGWIDKVADPVVRTAALVATWCAIVLLSRRCGGRTVVFACFAAVVLGVAGAFPETWALAGAAVTAGVAFGLVAMVYTRPASGVGLVRELVISASIGVLGALVLAGYHVELRPYRFRIIVLALTLACALLLAWRFGNGARSIGRRGAALILVGVVVLAGSLAYAQAVRSWGSPSVVQNLADFKAAVSDLLGAAPRPVEALVGFPALVWGVAVRGRRRQGWWMCAFGALGAAGVTTSLIRPDVGFWSAMASTGYDVAIGLGIGLAVVFVDGLLTGGGRRADATRDLVASRPEPARLTPLI
jgi:hypothetical protein